MGGNGNSISISRIGYDRIPYTTKDLVLIVPHIAKNLFCESQFTRVNCVSHHWLSIEGFVLVSGTL